MPRFAANLSLLYPDLPLPERFGAAARAGFRAVELQFPYAWPAATLAAELARQQLTLVLHNLPAGDWAAGDRGIATDPARIDEFHAGVERAIEYALALGRPRLNCLAGIPPAGVSTEQAGATLLDNLRHAAGRLAAHDLTLLIEPINTFDIPGFFVSRSAQALALIERVGAPNLALQYDIYHAQRMEGELGNTLRACLDRIGHIQIADNPGRHEPGSGEINYRYLFDRLDALGYGGYVGCEYLPADVAAGGTDAGLAWLADHGQSL